MIHLTAAQVISVLISLVIPLLSSLLSRAQWPQEITGILTIVLSTGTAFLVQWQHDGDHFDWRAAAGTALLAAFTAWQARARLWAGTKTDAKALAVGSKRTAPPAAV